MPVVESVPLVAEPSGMKKTDTNHGAKRAIKLATACEMLSLSPSTLRRLINNGTIKKLPYTRHLVIPISEIDRLLNSAS